MSNVGQSVEAAANRWMQAWVQRDAAALEELLAPDFALVISATPAQRLDRASWLATACTRYVASQFRYRDVQVRDLGAGMAVMSSVAEFTAEIDGRARNGPLFLVDVWRQHDGRWQVCARYSSSPEHAHPSAQAVASIR